jgi:1-acyl-sn-glycerol-3-phosphate acyltransferase
MEVRGTLRKVARASGFIGLTAAMLPPFYLHTHVISGDDPVTREKWVGRWSSLLLSLFSIRLDVLGGPIPAHGVDENGKPLGRLVVTNHRSAIDIGILLYVVGGKMVSRADIATWPVVGPAARAVGTIFVDRKSSHSGVVAIRTMQSELEAGETVNIFPEGTTFIGDEIRPFHRGGFVAARAAKSEILPIGLAYEKGSGASFFGETFMSHLSRMSAAPKPTRVALVVGAPFVANAPAAVLARRAENEVAALVAQARAHLGDGD